MLQRKNSNKQNLPPQFRKKQRNQSKSHKMKSSTKSSKSPSLGKSPTPLSKETRQCRQRELSDLKCQVRKMRKQVQLFKTYYLTHANSYRSIQQSQTQQGVPLQGGRERRRSAPKEEEYLINGSQSFCSRDQSEYYIQYYLEN